MAISPVAQTAEVMRMMRFISPNPFPQTPFPLFGLVTAFQSKLDQQSYSLATTEPVSHFGQ